MASTNEFSGCLAFQTEGCSDDDSKACGRVQGIWRFLIVAERHDGGTQCRNPRNFMVNIVQ